MDGFPELISKVASRYRRKIRFRIAKLRYITIFDGQVPFQSPLGPIKLQVDPHWDAVGKYASGEIYEPVMMEELTNNLGDNDVFYNIGARWGIFSRLASFSGVPDENIHSFEADITAYCLLGENLLDLNTHFTHTFISSEIGPKSTTLNAYAQHHDQPTVVKIDVEGAEGQVLRGGSKVLKQKPTIYVEIHPEKVRHYGDNQHEILEILQKFGYDMQVCLDNRDRDIKWTPIEEVDIPEGNVDYLIKGT